MNVAHHPVCDNVSNILARCHDNIIVCQFSRSLATGRSQQSGNSPFLKKTTQAKQDILKPEITDHLDGETPSLMHSITYARNVHIELIVVVEEKDRG